MLFTPYAERITGAAAALVAEQDRVAYVIRDVVLSTRELEIARRVARGHTNKEIAQALHLSQYTVRDHVSALLRKYGVRSRTELAVHLVECMKAAATH
jgi:DNA-binding NarL/FixJ family response regulator